MTNPNTYQPEDLTGIDEHSFDWHGVPGAEQVLFPGIAPEETAVILHEQTSLYFSRDLLTKAGVAAAWVDGEAGATKFTGQAGLEEAGMHAAVLYARGYYVSIVTL